MICFDSISRLSLFVKPNITPEIWNKTDILIFTVTQEIERGLRFRINRNHANHGKQVILVLTLTGVRLLSVEGGHVPVGRFTANSNNHRQECNTIQD